VGWGIGEVSNAWPPPQPGPGPGGAEESPELLAWPAWVFYYKISQRDPNQDI
jgi:hypothetical protein